MHTVYYFTGTGNSLQIAQDIAQKLGGSIKKIADYQGENIKEETLGIVFPVYEWGIPLIVDRFLKKLQVDPHTYIYAVTHFNGAPGKALIQCQERLNERKLQLSAGYLIQMPGNCIFFNDARSEKDQQKMFANEKKKIEVIAENTKKKKSLKLEKKYPLLTKIIGNKMYEQIQSFPERDRQFVVSDKCIGCGLCEKNCPVHNIRLENGRPSFLHHCEVCLGCLQYCPERAIEYGTLSVGRTRYHNPNVTRK